MAMMPCKHMDCREADLPKVGRALTDFGLDDVTATFETCPWCQQRVLCIIGPRPDDRGRIRAALIVGGFIVPDDSGARNTEAVTVNRDEAIDLRMLT